MSPRAGALPEGSEGGMQTKEGKTAEELQIEISSRLGGLVVIVHGDSISGWTATVILPPSDVADQSSQIAQIISELRAKYDLKEDLKNTDPAGSDSAAPFAEPGSIDCAQEPICSAGMSEPARSGNNAGKEK
jgi:hypothetical protein